MLVEKKEHKDFDVCITINSEEAKLLRDVVGNLSLPDIDRLFSENNKDFPRKAFDVVCTLFEELDDVL
jgi:hypothetical protein